MPDGFQEYLEEFYARYNVELIRAPEGFFLFTPTFHHSYPAFRLVGTGYDGREKSSVISISARNGWRMRGFSPSRNCTTNCSPWPMKQNC
ncbi:chromosome partition protein MukE [Escherichia coli]|uniref:chromosome partition protein MukE n=1 Tax=Escherichia coli TaxID=562 RepID=UPI0032E4EBEB